MARRYADGRATYATTSFNHATRTLLSMGIDLGETIRTDGTIWARDGHGRAYDGLTDEEAALGRRPEYLRSHEEYVTGESSDRIVEKETTT